MDKGSLIKRLMVTFLEEMDEHLNALNRDLLTLEKDPESNGRSELLKALFRTAHSMKGAARSVNVTLIESACHRLEEILAAAQEGQVTVNAGLFGLLFTTADAIEEVGMRLRERQNLDGAPLALLLPKLEAVIGRSEGEKSIVPGAEGSIAPGPDVGGPAHSGSSGAGPLTPPGPTLSSIKRTIRRRGPRAVPEDRVLKLEDRESKEGDGILGQASSILDPQSSIFDPPPLSEPPPEAATVRVSAEKLDAFLAQSGELLVARRRVRSRADDLKALREFVAQWKTEWRVVEKTVGKVFDPDDPEKGNGLVLHDSNGRSTPLPRRTVATLDRAGRQLRQLEKELDRLVGNMVGDGRYLDQAAGSLDAEVRRVRMIPFAEACQGLDRMVRDLAQPSGKDVELVVEGGKNELDRSVLEGLKDPLRHLVRNAVDHGVEPVEQRRAAGKRAKGRITVSAVLHGAHVEVVVADDGRGLDLEALRQQIRKKNLPEPADERDLARVIFHPGFSTAQVITDVSGRGVGLDVVKNRVEALHGTVDLSFTAGRGTRFTLAVPLTLTTLRALLVETAGQTFALATTYVQKLVRIDPANLRSVGGRQMLTLGGAPLPIATLAQVLGIRDQGLGSRKQGAGSRDQGLGIRNAERISNPQRSIGSPSSSIPNPQSLIPNHRCLLPAVIVAAGEKQMALVVDEFLGEQEVVVKNLGARIRRVRNISGATILPSGRLALVLNAASLIRRAMSRPAQTSPLLPEASRNGGESARESKKRLLVADDSVTTRTLEKSILEGAGYEVVVAVDGANAWELLQERGADLLVSDVEMPRMDGFALTEAVRGSKRFADLPVVLVTARETDQDKARGIEAGADAYLVKSGFDQKNLLETIAQLL
jgi:two-component system chemotaxis sensor kinase CheA